MFRASGFQILENNLENLSLTREQSDTNLSHPQNSLQRKTGFRIVTSWHEEDLIREIDLYMPLYQCRLLIFRKPNWLQQWQQPAAKPMVSTAAAHCVTFGHKHGTPHGVKCSRGLDMNQRA
ncbi:hypothetical protein Tco_0185010 [Tanacetum coccineum]